MTHPKSWRPRGPDSSSSSQAHGPQDDWEATRALTQLATQFLTDKADYVGPNLRDIGRAVGDNAHELFVTCDPAPAMLQQFAHSRPEFVAVHDIGTKSSRKFLSGLAAACGREMQQLVIRRQGFGTTLATLDFVELPGADGRVVRLYTTETEADTASRRALARVLLGHSRLAVVMVGDLPGHALASAMKPLHEDMIAGPWPNQDLLLLPMVAPATVATQGNFLARGSSVNVRTTPQVTSAADAWNFLSGSWHRLRERLAKEGTAIPALTATAPTKSEPNSGSASAQSASMRPMPDVSRGSAAAERVHGVAPTSAMGRYMYQISELKGVVSCCVFDTAKVRSVAAVGVDPTAESLARCGAALLSSIGSVSRSLGLGHALPDAAISLGAHFLVLRPLPKHPGLVLHAVLDKNLANLTLARLQIDRTDAVFDDEKP